LKRSRVSEPAFEEHMSFPISPAPVLGSVRNELPAYVANGVIGLRVRDMALGAGMTLVSGYSGEHPQRHIEAIAVAPYPVAGDIQIAGTWLSDTVYAVTIIDQAYNFATGELLSRFEFESGSFKARVEVLVFCSRDEPSLVCQEVTVTVDGEVDLSLKAIVDGRHVDGRPLRFMRDTPGEEKPACDGVVLWESAGALSTCGIAYATELIGAEAKPDRPSLEKPHLDDQLRVQGRGRITLPIAAHSEFDPEGHPSPTGFRGGSTDRQGPQARVRGDPRGQPKHLGRCLEEQDQSYRR
jgi:hypothetical protein